VNFPRLTIGNENANLSIRGNYCVVGCLNHGQHDIVGDASIFQRLKVGDFCREITVRRLNFRGDDFGWEPTFQRLQYIVIGKDFLAPECAWDAETTMVELPISRTKARLVIFKVCISFSGWSESCYYMTNIR
jgi:hypothetical protein